MDIRVMLADDHILMRKGIRQLMESWEGFQVVDEAGNGRECIDRLLRGASSMPQVLLTDISMPEGDGFWVLQNVRERLPQMKVLFLTAHEEPEHLSRAMSMGADGYLSKNAEPTELQEAIRIVLDGKTYIQARLRDSQGGQCPECVKNRISDTERLNSLTDREREILIHVAKGMLNKEIGASLHITERTVKNHLSCIFRKLDLSDRTQAAVFAIRNHVLELL